MDVGKMGKWSQKLQIYSYKMKISNRDIMHSIVTIAYSKAARIVDLESLSQEKLL